MSKQIPDILARLRTGDVLVADGSTGATLQQRGLPAGVVSEAWLFEKPEEILRLHRDFLDAGADIVLTNTFGGTRLRLDAAGLADRVREVNLRAVELAKEAVGGSNALVAGSLGPVGGLIKPYGALEEVEVFAAYREQAEALDEGGADLLVVETQFDLKEAAAAVRAVREVSSLPLVCSFSYDRGQRTMMGVKPEQMAAEISPLGVDLLGVNCGRSLDDNLAVLKELRAATDLPLWFKPNAGMPSVDSQGNTIFKITPQEMGAAAKDWGMAGAAQVVGGCCGTSAAHLQAIAQAVKSG